MPVAIFYGVYSFWGIVPALCVSIVISIACMTFGYLKEKRLSNTHLFGLVGLLLSLLGVLCTHNEKLYYIPALVNNCVFFLLAASLALQKKSIFHYMIRDFGLKISDQIPEKSLRIVNILWSVFLRSKFCQSFWASFFLISRGSTGWFSSWAIP